MLLPVFNDLMRPQWRLVMQTLKSTGGLTVREIAEHSKCSYMAAKSHCEALVKLGYVVRTRIPRSEVGRPEIFYSIAAKGDALFPQAGTDFTLALLTECQAMFGDMAPDKLLFQYFAKLGDSWGSQLARSSTMLHRASRLAMLRNQLGGSCACEHDATHARLVEIHNPLHPILAAYPRAITMEQRAIEQALGTEVNRKEKPAGPQAPAMVIFEFPHGQIAPS